MVESTTIQLATLYLERLHGNICACVQQTLPQRDYLTLLEMWCHHLGQP